MDGFVFKVRKGYKIMCIPVGLRTDGSKEELDLWLGKMNLLKV